MKFEADTLYIWVGGSCDYGHKERAGGGAYIAERDGETVDSYSCAEFNTTEFRMMLMAMIRAMEKFAPAGNPSGAQKMEFLSNVQYLQNFDKADGVNGDLIEKCIALKKQFASVTVRILPFHKFPQQKQVHEMASNAMRKLRMTKDLSASQMLRVMRTLSAEAEEAGVADMTLDEINAEIDAARKG